MANKQTKFPAICVSWKCEQNDQIVWCYLPFESGSAISFVGSYPSLSRTFFTGDNRQESVYWRLYTRYLLAHKQTQFAFIKCKCLFNIFQFNLQPFTDRSQFGLILYHFGPIYSASFGRCFFLVRILNTFLMEFFICLLAGMTLCIFNHASLDFDALFWHDLC